MNLDIKLLRKLKLQLNLIIPLCCVGFWAFIAVLKDGFTLIPAADFPTFYYVSQLIFTHPEQIYFFKVQPYPYTPFFAMLMFPMGLLTFEQAHWYYFFLILTITALCLIIFNQILILKNVTNKFHRLLYLMAISNGTTNMTDNTGLFLISLQARLFRLVYASIPQANTGMK